MPDSMIDCLIFDDKKSCIDSKVLIQNYLDEHNLLHRSESSAITNVFSGELYSLISMHLIVAEKY